MNFDLSESEALIGRTARDYARKRLAPAAAAIDEQERFPEAELRELAQLGMMGINVPAALGGAEAGAVAYAVALTEIARGCASTAVTMAVTNMVAETICRFG